jgi:hypothetical protein
MSIYEDAPASFGFPTFVKMILPGLFGSFLLLYSIFPHKLLSLPISDQIIILVPSGAILGLLIVSLDSFIYHTFEGINWPNHIRLFFEKRNVDLCLHLLDEFDKKMIASKDAEGEEALILSSKRGNLTHEIRQYPRTSDEFKATRLGNVIAEYEGYSRKQYGMDFSVFWSHLRYILPQETRDDIDSRGARADFLVYSAFILLLSTPVMIVRALFIKCEIYAIIKHFVSIDLFWTSVLIVFGISLAFVAMAYGIYRLAVSAHYLFGWYVKTVFNLYRQDLAKKLDMPATLVPNTDEKYLW